MGKETWRAFYPKDSQRYCLYADHLCTSRLEHGLPLLHNGNQTRKRRRCCPSFQSWRNRDLQSEWCNWWAADIRFSDGCKTIHCQPKKNINAYPPDWADTFSSNYYCLAQAQELARFNSRDMISNEVVAYRDSDIQVTSPDEVDKNIEQAYVWHERKP